MDAVETGRGLCSCAREGRLQCLTKQPEIKITGYMYFQRRHGVGQSECPYVARDCVSCRNAYWYCRVAGKQFDLSTLLRPLPSAALHAPVYYTPVLHAPGELVQSYHVLHRSTRITGVSPHIGLLAWDHCNEARSLGLQS